MNISKRFEESETLELKASTSLLKEAIISMVSILNKHQYGEVVFGVKDDGTPCGQDVSRKTVRDISQAISENIEPKIFPTITCFKSSGKTCITVKFKGNHTPYFAYGRAYMRVADENRQITAKELESMILKKNNNNLRWDSQLSDTSLKEVNNKVLSEFIVKANKVGRLDFKYQNEKATLKKLGLLKGKKLLNAGVALFCNTDLIEVQMAIFAGTDKLTFLDIKQLKGNIFYLLKETELYIKNNMKWRVQFGKLEREEIPEVPITAIREALVNSFCHKDYNRPESNKISIFKNRIEIYNPGDFPEGLTPADFIKGDEESVLRNPLIAQNIYYSKEIEKFGSGLKRIYDQCRENNVKVEFGVRKTGFFVTFFRLDWETGSTGDTVKDTAKDTVNILSKNEKTIMQELIKDPKATANDISVTIGINIRNTKKSMAGLKLKGIIKRIGSDKSGYWKVLK